MQLRNYVPADWNRLCEIHDAARRHELSAAGLSDAFLTLEQTAQGEGLFDGQLTVAEVDGEVQGFAAFKDGELTWLYVDPSMYRKGVGRALLRHVIAASPGEVTTEVLVGNEAALALYLAEGFVIQKRSDGKLAGNEGFAASGYVLSRSGDAPPSPPHPPSTVRVWASGIAATFLAGCLLDKFGPASFEDYSITLAAASSLAPFFLRCSECRGSMYYLPGKTPQRGLRPSFLWSRHCPGCGLRRV